MSDSKTPITPALIARRVDPELVLAHDPLATDKELKNIMLNGKSREAKDAAFERLQARQDLVTVY